MAYYKLPVTGLFLVRTCTSSPSCPKLGLVEVNVSRIYLKYVRDARALKSFTVATDIVVKSLITEYILR